MPWIVRLADEFEQELLNLEREVRNKLAATAKLLEVDGPQLGRPHVDTLNGAKHPNMKELRFAAAGGAWRVAFAFDPARQAILLVAGDKAGGSEDRFYKRLIATADARYARHLQQLGKAQGKKGN
jgi:hypothetical protein